MQCRSRVIQGEERCIAVGTLFTMRAQTSVRLADLGVRRKDSQSVPAKRGDHPWLERLQLSRQERGARCRFVPLRVAVLGRSTFHGIQDVDLFAAKAY